MEEAVEIVGKFLSLLSPPYSFPSLMKVRQISSDSDIKLTATHKKRPTQPASVSLLTMSWEQIA